MKYLIVVLCLSLGLVGCIPPKETVYPTIQAPVVNKTPPRIIGEGVTTTTPPYVPPPPAPLIPSTPNPYLNQTAYPSIESYYPEKPNYHFTPWMPMWSNYPQPEVLNAFWTGTMTVTVQ